MILLEHRSPVNSTANSFPSATFKPPTTDATIATIEVDRSRFIFAAKSVHRQTFVIARPGRYVGTFDGLRMVAGPGFKAKVGFRFIVDGRAKIILAGNCGDPTDSENIRLQTLVFGNTDKNDRDGYQAAVGRRFVIVAK